MRVRSAMAARLKRWLRMVSLSTPNIGGPADRVTIGSGVNLMNTLMNTHCGHISIGDHAFFGYNVMLLTGSHDIRATGEARQVPRQVDDRDIEIGEGAWIGSQVIVVGPCRIGRNAVIAPGVVVDFDVPDGSIVRVRREVEVEPIRFTQTLPTA